MNNFADIFANYGLVTIGVWGMTEAISAIPFVARRFENEKPLLAILVGVFLVYLPLVALGMFRIDGIPLWKNFIVAAVLGTVAISASGMVNDKFYNPIKKYLKGESDESPASDGR